MRASSIRPARPQNERAAFSEAGRGLRREKLFGDGRLVPLDRNAKVRVMTLARALMRRTEPGKAYGAVTAKALAVLQALLWGFHNAASGKCFPSYEAIAERAGCARSTVAEAIRTLERAGLLSWVNRIKRVREYMPGLFGKASAWRWRVVRTSNGYSFADPASKSEKPTRTSTQAESKKEFASNVPRAEGENSARRAQRAWQAVEQKKTFLTELKGEGSFRGSVCRLACLTRKPLSDRRFRGGRYILTWTDGHLGVGRRWTASGPFLTHRVRRRLRMPFSNESRTPGLIGPDPPNFRGTK
jgi:Helix-turn-helix domain